MDDYRTEVETNIMALKWYDNILIYLVSSNKDRYPVERVKCWSVVERQYIEVPRPAMVKEYNCHVGGVDWQDMLVASYRTNIGVSTLCSTYWTCV